MAATQDICAFVMVFPMPDGTYRIVPRFWAPSEANKVRERNSKAKIDHWFRDKSIIEHEGDEVTFDDVRRDIIALRERFDIRKIGRDRWNSVQIGQQLEAEGFEVVGVVQGVAMSPAAKELERLASTGLLRHGGHEVMDWMASNVSVIPSGDDTIRISKKKSADKIDGIVGAVMGIGLCMAEPIVNQIEEIRWG